MCEDDAARPLLIRRGIGRGAVWTSTLPFDLGASDLPVRPAFLVLLERFVAAAGARGGARSIEVGQSFVLSGVDRVEAKYLAGSDTNPSIEIARAGSEVRVPTSLAGEYQLDVDGKAERRSSPQESSTLRLASCRARARSRARPVRSSAAI
jgi:hypothetical protein